MNNAVFEKTIANARKHRDKLYQLKQEGIICCQNETIIQQCFFEKFMSSRNEKKKHF